MDVLHERCAGLDVHKQLIVACVRVFDGSKAVSTVRSFGTTTKELLALSSWLESHEVECVAMEATGVYWRPVWHILAEVFDLVLANPARIKNVPGRKTDVKDAEWIAELLAHGLIPRSFVPPPVIQEARDLTRTRKQLRREKVAHTQRIQKLLEDANLKLTSVLTDTLGVTGRLILEALIQGETNPEALAELAQGKAKAKKPELREALFGRVTDHHRFMLQQHLNVIDSIEQTMAQLDSRLDEVLRPFRDDIARLCTIPGVGELAAQVIIAEIGADMTVFPTAADLRSWARLCPRSDKTAGKKRSKRIQRGCVWLKTVLVQGAWAASRTKGTYTSVQFHRFRGRGGAKKAAVAVANSMLTAAYFILKDKVPYIDLGADHFEKRAKRPLADKLIRSLQRLGYDVHLTPIAETA